MFWLYFYLSGVIVAYIALVSDLIMWLGFKWKYLKISWEGFGFILLSWGLVFVLISMWVFDSYKRKRDV